MLKTLALAGGALALAPLSFSQQTVALYDFESSSLSSSHTAPNAVTDLALSLPHMYWFAPPIGETLLCMGTEWQPGGQWSFTVTPAPGVPLDLTRFSFKTWKDRQTSPVTVDGATVTVDGMVLAVFDPLLPIGDWVVDLSGVPSLQNVMRPITFVVDFRGVPSGRNSYEVREILVEAASCVEPNANGNSFWLTIPGEDPRWRPIEGAKFVETGNDTATMSGAIVSVADPCKRFSFDLQLSGRVDPGDPGYPPPNSPYLTPFTTANLVGNGGTIDPSTWHYYTNVTGTLTGKLCYDGALVTLGGVGAALQVGVGANGVDLSYGSSSWFQVLSLTQPTTGTTIPTPFVLGDLNTSLGNSCRCFGGTPASWNNYGTGVAGCAGVPSLTMPTLPLVDSPAQISVGNAGAMTQACALFWGFAPAQIFVPLLGGDLLVAPPYAAVQSLSVPPGGFTFTCTIDDNPCQVGFEVFLQAVCIDQCGPQGFALSRGMRVVIGDV